MWSERGHKMYCQAIPNRFNWISFVLQLKGLIALCILKEPENLVKIEKCIFRGYYLPFASPTLKSVFIGVYDGPIFSLNNVVIRFQNILCRRRRRLPHCQQAHSCFYMYFYILPPARNVQFLSFSFTQHFKTQLNLSWVMRPSQSRTVIFPCMYFLRIFWNT